MLSRSIKFGPVRAAAVGAVAALQLFAATAEAQEKTPIRVGVMLPFTGPAAATGQEKFQGIELAVAETGFSIGGHKIELLRSDDQNNPNVALTEARRLVENENVSAILGNLSSAVSIAINPYTARHEIPFVTSGIAIELTGSKKSPFTFRSSFASGQVERPLAYYLYTRGYRKGILMGSDYSAGHDAVTTLGGGFKQLGGTVLQEIFPRAGETDYGPFLSRVAGSGADFVFGYFFGGDTLRFVRQYQDFNVGYPLVITTSAISAGGVPDALGKSIVGIESAEVYMWTLQTPANLAFVKAYQERYKTMPSTLSYDGYMAGRVLVAGAQALDGNVADRTALAQAMHKVVIDGPAGKFRYDENNNPIINLYITRWEDKDGKIVPSIVREFHDIGLDWTPPK